MAGRSMGVVGDAARQWMDERIEPRDEVHHRTRCTLADRRTLPMTIVNISPHGLMARCDGAFAGYGLSSHNCYSTKEHQAALKHLGPCRLHRRSFWRIAAFYETQEELPLAAEESVIAELAAAMGSPGEEVSSGSSGPP